MKVLTQEEERAHYSAVLRKGFTYGGVGLGGGLAAAGVLNRTWAPFRSLTLPFKTFAVTSVATFALIVGADRGSRAFEADSYADLGWEENSLEARLGLQQKKPAIDHDQGTGGKLLAHMNEHRYSYLLGGWATSLAGSFGYISRSPLSTPQKVVQARMYAQGLTILLLLASAGIAVAGQNRQEAEEQEWKRESGIYRFKKGSPHEKEEQKRHQAAAAQFH